MMLSRILLLFCFALSTELSAIEPEKELSQVMPSRVMTVALANNIKPYQFVQDGQAQGFVVDWWRLWGAVNGYSIEFKMATWQDSIDLVIRGDADLHGGIQSLASREQQLHFSKPIINIQSQLFLTNDVVSTQLIRSLYPYVVGVIKGSAMIDMINQQYPLLTVSVFDNRQQLINAVKAANIKVVAGIAASALLSPEMTSLFPQNKRIDLFNHPISVATLKKNHFLIDIVERGRANMSDTALRELALKWFSSRQNNAKLILATPLHYAPIAAISPEGKPYGYLIDLWDLWAKKNNTLIDFMPSYRTAILDNVRSGLADLTLSYPDHQMTKGLVKGRKMATVEVDLFYYTDKFQRLTRGDLAGRKVGYDSAVFGHQNIAKLKQLFPKTQFLPLKSIYELINAVRGGDVAAVVMTELFAKSTFSNLNLGHQFKRVKDFSFQFDVFLWANVKIAPVLTEIAQGFDLISKAEINQLKQKWFSGNNANNRWDFTDISKDETKWISDNSTVRFGYVAARAPFEFVNQHNNMEGINRTTLDLIADKTGLVFTFHPYPSAGKLLDALHHHEVDVISSVYEQSSHWGNLNLTQPYWDSSIAAISRNGETYINLTAMKGKVIAINANSSYRQYLQEMLPEASLVEVDSVARGVKSVADGNAQIYIGNILMAAQEIRENTYNNLTINIIDSVPLANPRFAIRNDWQPLVNIFDKAVLKITATERLTLFEQWLKYSLTVEAKYRELIDFMIPISILLFGVFCCFVYWNKRLSNEIKLRTQLQSKFEYQAKHDELTGLPNRAQLKEEIKEKLLSHHQRGERLLCLFIDLNGFKAINDTYGHDVGDILLIQFSRRLNNHLRHQDFVSRFGGDEFIVLASLNDSQQGSDAITKMVRSLYKDPIIIENLSIKVSCSIGGAVFPDDGTTFEQLIKIADQRMYLEKNNKSLDNVTRVSFR